MCIVSSPLPSLPPSLPPSFPPSLLPLPLFLLTPCLPLTSSIVPSLWPFFPSQLAKHTTDFSEAENQLRKSFSRQHARDISEYTKQIHVKDRENQELRRRLSKASLVPVLLIVIMVVSIWWRHSIQFPPVPSLPLFLFQLHVRTCTNSMRSLQRFALSQHRSWSAG